MIKVNHLHLNNLGRSGSIDRITQLDKNNTKVENYSSIKENADMISNDDLLGYDMIIVHDSIRLLSNVINNANKQEVCFIGHGNIISKERQTRWKKTVLSTNTKINVITGSYRSAQGFPDYNSGMVDIWIAPTYGISKDFIRDYYIENPNRSYDIGYFGRVDPDKRVSDVIRIANIISEKYNKNIKLNISGPEVCFKNDYWGDYCSHMINSNVNLFRNHYLPGAKFYKYMQECSVIILPSTSVWETWCGVAWEALVLNCSFIGSDWAGISEAMNYQSISPFPVNKTSNGFRSPPYKLSDFSGDFRDFNGYKPILDGIDRINNIIEQKDDKINTTKSIPTEANIMTFIKVLKKIHSGRSSKHKPTIEFSNDLNHLGSV